MAIVGALDAQQACEAVGAGSGEPHGRAGDLLENRKRPHNLLGHALGVGKANALGYKLANNNRDKRYNDGDEHRCKTPRDSGERSDAKPAEPVCQRVRKTRRGNSRRRKTHERDSNLNGRQEFIGIGGELCGLGSTTVALLRLVLEHRTFCRGQRHLGHREEAVHDREKQRGDNADGYVHRDGFKPPRGWER